MTIGNGMKILENFGENRLWRKIQDNQHLTTNFQQAVKVGGIRAIFYGLGSQVNKILKISMKFSKIFDQNLYGKLTFPPNSLLIIMGFLPLLRKSIALEDNTSFPHNFSDFMGFRLPPYATDIFRLMS